MSETEKPLASDSIRLPPEVVTPLVDQAPFVEPPPNVVNADGLPDWEPITPEHVEDEAIRGDFMLRWAVVLLGLLIGCRQIVETTTLVHVKTGQYLASHGYWPPQLDVFSSTANKHRWVNLSWLWDLISCGLFAIGEGIGLSLATAILVATTWWLLAKCSRQGVSSWFGSILGALTLLACHLQFSGQPETVTLFGLAATSWWLFVWRTSNETKSSASLIATSGGPASLWWLVPGFVLWSNLDNRMFLGLVLLTLWGLGEFVGSLSGRTSLTFVQRTHFWKVLGTCVVVSCFNPFGGQSLLSPIVLYGTEYPAWRDYVLASSLTDETGAFSLLNSDLWQPSPRRLPLVAGVTVLSSVLISIVLNARRANLGDVLAFGGFVGLAAVASHELAAASVVACVIGTLNAQQWYQSSFRQTYSIETKELLFTRGGRALTVLAFFALAVMSINQSLFGLGGKRVGLGLSVGLRAMITAYRDATANSFDDRPFNFMPSQGDVLLWIDQKPFLDSRLSVFAGRGESDLLALHDQTRQSLAGLRDQMPGTDQSPNGDIALRSGDDWRSVFRRYQMTHAMPRLYGGNPVAYFRMLVNPELRLTHLGSHCAVFYDYDEADSKLVQFVDVYQFAIRKSAFQSTELSSPRTDWPRSRTAFQKWLGPPPTTLSNKVLESENLLLHLRGLLSRQLLIDQPTAMSMAHLAIRKANAGLSESVDNSVAYQVLGEAYSFLLDIETSILNSNGRMFENRLRFYQAMGAYYQAIQLEPKSLILRFRFLELLQRFNRFDLMLRELEAIENLSPNAFTEDSEEDEALQRRIALREQCENRKATLQDQINSILEQGQSAAELAPQVYASGFVLEALRLLELDPTANNESPDLLVLRNLLRFESGEIEEVYDAFEFESDSNPAAWRIPAAWTRLAHGEYDRATELWKMQSVRSGAAAVTTVMYTLPMTQSPLFQLGYPNIWPSQHALTIENAQSITANENAQLLWYTAMGQIEDGNPQLAGKTLAGLLELYPESPLRPLVGFYLYLITDELIDPEPPSDWIPIDAEMFMPDDTIDTEKK